MFVAFMYSIFLAKNFSMTEMQVHRDIVYTSYYFLSSQLGLQFFSIRGQNTHCWPNSLDGPAKLTTVRPIYSIDVFLLISSASFAESISLPQKQQQVGSYRWYISKAQLWCNTLHPFFHPLRLYFAFYYTVDQECSSSGRRGGPRKNFKWPAQVSFEIGTKLKKPYVEIYFRIIALFTRKPCMQRIWSWMILWIRQHRCINYIHAKTLNRSQFRLLFEKEIREYSKLHLSYAMRWLPRGSILKHFFNLREQMLQFLEQKEALPLETDLLKNTSCMSDLAFIVDITNYHNILNHEVKIIHLLLCLI